MDSRDRDFGSAAGRCASAAFFAVASTRAFLLRVFFLLLNDQLGSTTLGINRSARRVSNIEDQAFPAKCRATYRAEQSSIVSQ